MSKWIYSIVNTFSHLKIAKFTVIVPWLLIFWVDYTTVVENQSYLNDTAKFKILLMQL